MNEKKNYTTEDNIRSMYFVMKELLEESKKISQMLSDIAQVLPKKTADTKEFPL